MDPDAAFFVALLAGQACFTAALILIVPRRRLPAYRFVAPAAVPILLLAFALYARARLASGAVAGDVGRLLVAYAVLWLAGVIWATLLIRIRPLLGR